ncbi:MAG: flagellar operon protein [Eubacterium sp.]|nr:flagellar operon protein [Eubacterium sp.]
MEQKVTDFTAASVIARIGQSASGKQKIPKDASSENKLDFGKVLENTVRSTSADDTISFSKHATQRLDQRGIEINDTLKDNLEQAVKKAREKGSREIAVIGKSGIFIVNVENNVVVTTMTEEDMKERILTNIDGAILI